MAKYFVQGITALSSTLSYVQRYQYLTHFTAELFPQFHIQALQESLYALFQDHAALLDSL
ncbi:MAG TPA: hypothetical protein VKF63_08685 [Terracidiphilus sp.]|nr:hypothetical protein [Terracidiphilus sp.]